MPRAMQRPVVFCLLFGVGMLLSCENQVFPICGDGKVQGKEKCDDGYVDACGTCNADCTGSGQGATCGDGIICFEIEFCDDGYTDACGTCNTDCSKSGEGYCGDGHICPETEFCDDGYSDNCGSCNKDCTNFGDDYDETTEQLIAIEMLSKNCGDGLLCSEYEFCDDGRNTDCGDCNADCTAIGSGPGTCGDGIYCPDADEKCDGSLPAIDFGNNNASVDGSGCCSTDCQTVTSTCGDGFICTTEICDDGYNDPCGTCNVDCSGPGSGLDECGNSIWCKEFEYCDDGYTDICGTCNEDCSGYGTGSICGNSEICEEFEVCDDDTGYCSADCTEILGFCGDGKVQGKEKCDDGNKVEPYFDSQNNYLGGDDLCSNDCQTFNPWCTFDNIDDLPDMGLRILSGAPAPVDGWHWTDIDPMITLCDGWVYIADRRHNQIKLVNVVNGLVNMTYQLSNSPGDMVLLSVDDNNDGNFDQGYLFVALYPSTSLARIDIFAKESPIKYFHNFPYSPHNITIANQGRLFAALRDPDQGYLQTVALINGFADKYIGTICSVLNPTGSCPAGRTCQSGLCNPPDNGNPICSVSETDGWCPDGLRCNEGECIPNYIEQIFELDFLSNDCVIYNRLTDDLIVSGWDLIRYHFDISTLSLTKVQTSSYAGDRYCSNLNITPDGLHLSAGDWGISLRDFNAQDLNETYGDWGTKYSYSSTFSIDGSHIAVMDSGGVSIYDTETHGLLENHDIDFWEGNCYWPDYAGIGISRGGKLIITAVNCGSSENLGKAVWFKYNQTP